MSADDFLPLKVIGRGAFGEVIYSLKFEYSLNLKYRLGSSSTKT